MDDASVLGRLAGQPGQLQAAVTSDARRVIRAVNDANAVVAVIVAGNDGGVLRLESADSRVLTLDGRAVVLDTGPSGTELLRLTGSLEVLSSAPPFLAALHPIMVPDRLQRRGSKRMVIEVIVRVALDEDLPENRVWHTTRSRDLSEGGVRVNAVDDVQVGHKVRVVLELFPALEVGGTVLDVMDNGTMRIRFVEVDDAGLLQLQAFLSALQSYE